MTVSATYQTRTLEEGNIYNDAIVHFLDNEKRVKNLTYDTLFILKDDSLISKFDVLIGATIIYPIDNDYIINQAPRVINYLTVFKYKEKGKLNIILSHNRTHSDNDNTQIVTESKIEEITYTIKNRYLRYDKIASKSSGCTRVYIIDRATKRLIQQSSICT